MIGILNRQQSRVMRLVIDSKVQQEQQKNHNYNRNTSDREVMDNIRTGFIQLDLTTGFHTNRYPQIAMEPLESSTVQYWTSFLNFGYYILVLPFKIHFNHELMIFQIKTNKLQMIAHIISAFAVIMYFILRCLYKISKLDITKKKPAEFFDLACYFFDSSALIPIYIILQLKRNAILETINQIQLKFNDNYLQVQDDSEKYDAYTKFKQIGSKNFLIGCLWCGSTISILLFNLLIIYEKVNWELSGIANYFLTEAVQVYGPLLSYFNSTNPNNNTNNYEQSPSSPLSIILTILAGVINSADGMLNTFADFLFPITIIMYREIVNNFLKRLKSQKRSAITNMAQILREYHWMKLITKKINESIGVITFAFILLNLPFFATGLFDSFLEAHAISRVKHVFVAFYYFASIFKAAEITQNMLNELRDWLWTNENCLKIPDGPLNMIIQEIESGNSNCPFGLRGFNLFTVNFAYFSAIVGLVVTYSLIKFQLRMSINN